jgi:hypothetical protein
VTPICNLEKLQWKEENPTMVTSVSRRRKLPAPLPVQEEVMEAAGDEDHQFDFFVDSIAVGEAFAHALQMEELAEVEVWDLVPPHAEGPPAVHAAPAGSQAVTHHFPAGPPVFDDDVGGAALSNANVHHVADAVPRHVPTRLRGNQQGRK